MIRGLILASLLLLTGDQYAPSGPHPPIHVLNPCAISAWAMNEGSGLTLHDSSPNGNTATINSSSSVTWLANAIKSGVTSPKWNATGFALAANTTITNFDGTTPFSASGWIFPNSFQNQTMVGTLDTASNFKGWELVVAKLGGSTYTEDFLVVNTYPSNSIEVRATTTFLPTALHYFVATYDGSRTAAGVKVYIDGSPVTTSTLNNSLTASSASGLPARIAARNDGTDGYFGSMAYVEVYNCVLTPTQISAYNASGPGLY